MKRAPLFVWLLVPACLAFATATAFAQAKKPEPAKQPAVAPATSAVPANVKPVKGIAVINVLKPVVKVQGERGRHHDQGEEHDALRLDRRPQGRRVPGTTRQATS